MKVIILLNDGSVHTYGSANDVLGHSEKESKVSALETITVVAVSAGGGHFFAIDNNGRLYAWGLNLHGQLGLKDSSSFSVPKLVKFSTSPKIVMVACGQEHSLFLCSNGTVMSTGNNKYGQLGLGANHENISEAMPMVSLQGIPFLQIAAGYWHSFALTASGTVFGWGRNDCGQLGLGHTTNSMDPALLKSLRTQVVTFIDAGESHSVALTIKGGVFTFGSNAYGQLGHGFAKHNPPTVNPRMVFELMGKKVTQIACGQNHTMTYVPDGNFGHVYGFGDNSENQLGYSAKEKENFLPHSLSFLELPYLHTSNNSMDHSGLEMSVYVKEIAAGGDGSVLITRNLNVQASDFCEKIKHSCIMSISNEFVAKLEASPGNQLTPDVAKYLDVVMSSQSCLNASFLADDHVKTTPHYHGISLMAARLAFSKIGDCKCEQVSSKMAAHLNSNLIPSLKASPPDIEALRLYIHLPECHLFTNSEYYELITIPFAMKCMALVPPAAKVLNYWYATLEPVYFIRPVDLYKESIEYILKKPIPVHYPEVQNFLRAALEFLGKLNQVSNSMEKPIIPYEKFYLPCITDHINLEEDYMSWLKNNRVSFCNYPFILNSEAKTSLLQIDATWQMRVAFSEAQTRNVASIFGLPGNHSVEQPVLELEINRQSLVQEALAKLAHVDMHSLKKPLVVTFTGEEGQDAGGVRKEFFMLILQEVIDPKYGMFRYYEDSRLMWFSNFGLETDAMYFLVGLLCGLAIYNSTIIDIQFPLALYKKLLGEKPTLADLHELDPTVAKGMQQLLDYNETSHENIEDIFCLNFTVTTDNFGEKNTIDLVPNGSSMAVTGLNRKDYVDAYLDYLFNTSVKDQYKAFSGGFLKVCGGKILKLFRPVELMEMVVGNQNYNWENFEKQATYKGEYYRNHPVIDRFWKVFHTFTLDEKKQFILFLTGCNKVPINGLKITIQPMRTGAGHLPVAHTCFNLLDLPPYESTKDIKEKLKLAMLNNQGFHLA
ncbi:unnamed protein product [Clavelina lepadiformis]|uniref:HECT domain-containing protein n=1 Tax=Clavelina lepadiformis TaxID=159417 RepID=A0ABP0F0N8_CLALP